MKLSPEETRHIAKAVGLAIAAHASTKMLQGYLVNLDILLPNDDNNPASVAVANALDSGIDDALRSLDEAIWELEQLILNPEIAKLASTVRKIG